MNGHPGYPSPGAGGRHPSDPSSRFVQNPHNFDSLGVVDAYGRTLTRAQFKEGRKKKGECPSCGQQLFDMKMGGLVKKPLTVPNKVDMGKCLVCADNKKKKKKTGANTLSPLITPPIHSSSPTRPRSHQSLPTSTNISSPVYQRSPHPQSQPSTPHSDGHSPYMAQQPHPQQQFFQPQPVAPIQPPSDPEYDDVTVYFEPLGGELQPQTFQHPGTQPQPPQHHLTVQQQQQQQQQFQHQQRPVSDGHMNAQEWSPSNFMQGQHHPSISNTQQAREYAQAQQRQIGIGSGPAPLPYFPTGMETGEMQGSASGDTRRMPVVQARPLSISRGGSSGSGSGSGSAGGRPMPVSRDGSSGSSSGRPMPVSRNGSGGSGGRPMPVSRSGSGGSHLSHGSSSHSFHLHQRWSDPSGNSTPTLQSNQQLSNSSMMSDRSARPYQSAPSQQEEIFTANCAIINEHDSVNIMSHPSTLDELCLALDELGRVGAMSRAEEEDWGTLDRILILMQDHGDEEMVQIKGMRICGSILTKCKQHMQKSKSQSGGTINEHDDNEHASLLDFSNSEKWIAHLLHLTQRSNAVTAMNAFMIMWVISEFSDKMRHKVATDEQSLPTILNALQQHRSHPDVLLYALLFLCGILKCDSEKNPNMVFNLKESSAMEDLLDVAAQDAYVCPLKVSEALCRVFWTISTQGKDYQEILLQDERPTQALVDLMNRFQSDEVIQTLACRTLSNLVQEDITGGNMFVELLNHGALDALMKSVITALKSHQRSEAVKQSALSFLAITAPMAPLSVLRETTECITEIMAASLQESSQSDLNLLSDLTFLFYGRAVQAASQGFVTFATFAADMDAGGDGDNLEKFNLKREQLMEALSILKTISDQVDASPLLPEEALGGIVEAVEFFGSNLDFCRTTFAFLISISFDENLCGALIKAGAVKVILTCINRHGLDFENLLEQGVELIGALFWADQNAMSSMTASDVASLLKLWQKHISNESLQKCALVLLRNLCSPESEAAIRDNDQTQNVASIAKYIFDVIEEYPQDVTIQEEALTALWSLLTLDNTESISTVKAAGGIPKIIKVMDQHGYKTELQEAALASLSVMATAPACSMEIVRNGGAVKAVSACTLHDIDGKDASDSSLCNKAEGVHEKAMFLICTLSQNDPSLNKSLTTNGAVPLAVRCLRVYPKSVKLVKAAIQLLAILSQEAAAVGSSSKQDTSVFATAGVHEALIALMSADDLDPAVTGNATKLFLMITSSRSPDLAKVDVIQIVITAMYNHKDLVEAQEKGVAALGELSVKDSEAKDTIAVLGGVEAIVYAMTHCLSSVECCEKGCVALWSLGIKQSVRAAIVRANGIAAIVHAMLAHMAQEPVVQSACGALITLTSQSSVRNAFRSADGTSTMLSAMKVHFHSPGLLEQCCNVLSNLAVYKDEDTVEYVTVEQMQTLARCMKLHPYLKSLQKSALRTLWNLSLIPFNVPIMKEAAEVLQEVLFAAASNFPEECGERVERLLNLLIF